eukprot:187809_1
MMAAHESESRGKNDYDIVRENYQLNRSMDYDEDEMDYGDKLAVNYEKELNKTYGIVDLNGYKKGKFGIRWRTKQEVTTGKGYKICAATKCNKTMPNRNNNGNAMNSSALTAFEVPFMYIEDGEYKHTNIKLRLCEDCGYKLNYKSHKKHRKKEKKRRKKEKRKNRKRDRKRTDAEHLSDKDKQTDKTRSRSRSRSRSRH